ncbi:unnamed protein product [Clavelina lepadiformis]|uniref:Pescadillo-like protein n=1 Tax=Clavelina lepadiformis TaxID=159417 RepID=A0ABP0EXI1_CLALP
MSQPITWIVPHNFPHAHPSDVDFRVMSTFTEFYQSMLGFVMYRLYQSINLHYPPKIPLLASIDLNIEKKEGGRDNEMSKFCSENEKSAEVVASLNTAIAKFESTDDDDDDTVKEEEEADELLQEAGSAGDEARKRRIEEKQFLKLFEGKRFFLSREVPRKQLVFIIR